MSAKATSRFGTQAVEMSRSLFKGRASVRRLLPALLLAGLLVGSCGEPSAEKQSVYSEGIVGPDENENGIRDDVDEYIDAKYDGERERAVRQFAKATTEKIALAAEGKSEEKVLDSVREGFDAIECIHHKIEDVEAASEAVLGTRARILNTYERSEAAEKVSGIAGGHVFERTGDEEKVCK